MKIKKSHHIAFYCSSTSWGGLEMNFARHAEWLSEADFTVEVFIVKNSPLDQHSWNGNSIRIHYIRKNKKYFDFLAAMNLKGRLRKLGIDQVWITDTRDMSTLAWVKNFSLGRLQIIYRQAMRLGVNKKDLVHTLRFRSIDLWISTLPYLAQEILEKTKIRRNKIKVVPLGLDLNEYGKESAVVGSEVYNFSVPKGKLVLGIIGRIDPLKGQKFVVEQMPKILKLIPNAHLLIVGESTKNEGEDFLEDLHRIVAKLNIEDHVTFHPFLKEKSKFYDFVDVVIVSSFAETFGMVTIEAMAAGKAILGTNTAGTPEILGQGKFGMLYEPHDSDSFLVGLEYLLHAENRMTIGALAREEAFNSYSKKSWVNKTKDLIESLR